MKILLPDNIFTSLLVNNLNARLKNEVIKLHSSLIVKELHKFDSSVALISTLELLSNRELFVSKKFGISFEGSLCNSYIYFEPEQQKITDLYLTGDVSSSEVILSKILFEENFDSRVELHLQATEASKINGSRIVVGDRNFSDDLLGSGISFAEEIIELISLPYVNFVFASQKKELIEELDKNLEGIEENILSNSDKIIQTFPLSETAIGFISDNISSAIYQYDEQDVEGITQLLRLPYYHQIVNDIVEVNFV